MGSRDVISCDVTATSCELQPCRSSNVPKTLFIGLLQPLPGDFQSNDVSSGSLLVTWGHHEVISCHVTPTSSELQPCRSSNVPKTWFISLLQPLPGDFRSNEVPSRSLPVTRGPVRSFPVTSLPPPPSYSSVGAQTYPKLGLRAFYSHFQVTSGQMTSLPGHFRSRGVT